MLVRKKSSNVSFIFCSCVATLIIVSVCLFHLSMVHKSYWGGKGQDPQGTIYAVQTVEYNIASHGMPGLAASALLGGDDELLGSIVNSAYGLTGFVISSCSQGSTAELCVDEKIIALTNAGGGWLNASNAVGMIAGADYAVLTTRYGAGVDWRYRAPKEDERISGEFSPEGDVIGRLYYVRRPAPAFSEQLLGLASSPLLSSTDQKYYIPIILSYLLGLFVVLTGFFWISRKFKEVELLRKEKLDFEKEAIGLQLELSEKESDKIKLSTEIDCAEKKIEDQRGRLIKLSKAHESLKSDGEKIEEELSAVKAELAILDQVTERTQELTLRGQELEERLAAAESEKDQVWSECIKAEQQLESLRQEKQTIYEHGELLKKDICDKNIEIKNLKALLDGNKKSVKASHRIVQAFISGLNIGTNLELVLTQDAYDDVEVLEKKGISAMAVNNGIGKLARISLSDKSFAEHYQQISSIRGVYHNKKTAIRFYFAIEGNDALRVLAIWSEDDAPHELRDRNWKVLQQRFASSQLKS